MKKINLLLIIAIFVSAFSCKKEDENPVPPRDCLYAKEESTGTMYFLECIDHEELMAGSKANPQYYTTTFLDKYNLIYFYTSDCDCDTTYIYGKD